MQEYPWGLKPSLSHGGEILPTEQERFRLTLPANSIEYSLAQLDDYRGSSRRSFLWTPPAKFEISARASTINPTGTLGFGFWNDPFTFSLGQKGAARSLPAPPQACWFFYGSEENDLPLARPTPGNGWKAATLRSPKIPTLLLAPLAGAAIGLSLIPMMRSWIIQSALNVVDAEEAILDVPLSEWHTYSLNWEKETARFFVDGELVLDSNFPPTGPLGFVLWIDNQFAVASPSKGFDFGISPTSDEEWLEIKFMTLSSS